jgi:fumarate reductase subunit C
MNTYKRPMAGWWKRNPFYLWYMLREASCLFITAYALVLLWGLYRLLQGRAFFEQWLNGLSSPIALAFHAAALVLVAYHAWTWFKIMPKTLPFVRVAGRRVPDAAIVAGGVAGVFACTALVLVLAWR